MTEGLPQVYILYSKIVDFILWTFNGARICVVVFLYYFFTIHLFGPHLVVEKGGSVWQNVLRPTCCRVKLTIFNIRRCSAAFSSSYASGSIVRYRGVAGKWRTNDPVWKRGHIFGAGADWRVEASSLQGWLLIEPKVSLHLKALQKSVGMKQKSWKLSTADSKNRQHLLGMAKTRSFWVDWTLRCEQNSLMNIFVINIVVTTIKILLLWWRLDLISTPFQALFPAENVWYRRTKTVGPYGFLFLI